MAYRVWWLLVRGVAGTVCGVVTGPEMDSIQIICISSDWRQQRGRMRIVCIYICILGNAR